MKTRRRRIVGVICIAVAAIIWIAQNNQTGSPIEQTPPSQTERSTPTNSESSDVGGIALQALERMPVKGRAPKTGYTRAQFGDGWLRQGVCDMRNIILNRDLKDVRTGESCKVVSGILHDPYTSETIEFKRGEDTSDDVQIDHVVALSNAWQTGAQLLTREQRTAFANDPLELLAVSGEANQAKGDGDAATWLPKNKAFRCQYVARQIAVKVKYGLWVTESEKTALRRVLDECPAQTLPIERP